MGDGKKVGPRAITRKIKREIEGSKKDRASRKVRHWDGISHCKVFRATAGKGEDDGTKDDADARGKTKGSERGKWSRLTGGCFGPVLVRFLSIRRPAAAERDLHTEDGDGGEWSRRMTRESRPWERERDPRDEKYRGIRERAAKHYAGWHDCGRVAREE